jgi:hypothetical protein
MGWRIDDSKILTPEQIKAGFYLEEDEDFVYVKKDDTTVATLNRNSSPASIRGAVYDEM